MTVRIVLVDDEPADRYLVKRLVNESGLDATFVEFKAGDEFLSVISDPVRRVEKIGDPLLPMLVLLDINMPRMTGFEVLRAMQGLRAANAAEPPDIAVVILSSSGHAEDQAKAFSCGLVKDYVVKPLVEEKLRDLVARHCA